MSIVSESDYIQQLDFIPKSGNAININVVKNMWLNVITAKLNLSQCVQ